MLDSQRLSPPGRGGEDLHVGDGDVADVERFAVCSCRCTRRAVVQSLPAEALNNGRELRQP